MSFRLIKFGTSDSLLQIDTNKSSPDAALWTLEVRKLSDRVVL
jgi:hypothetical protein